MKELWKDVIGYKNYYQVSSFGRVRSLDRYLRQWKGKQLIKGKNLKLHVTKTNRLRVDLCKETVRHFFVHRLVAINFIPNLDKKPYINHKDGNPKNNNVFNLEWCTHRENTDHAVAHKLHIYGVKHGMAKLTEREIAEIRIKYEPKKYGNVPDLAKEYGISKVQIYNIISKREWRYL